MKIDLNVNGYDASTLLTVVLLGFLAAIGWSLGTTVYGWLSGLGHKRPPP